MPANDHDPAWMPDGQSLIFMSERDSRGDLYRVWLADKRVERLTRNFAGRAMMPNVSPDGKLVTFAAQSLERLQFWLFQIHVLDLATGRTRPLDATGGSCWPSWSPDGRTIAHVMLDREPSMLQLTSAEGVPIRQLAGDKARWHYYPEWSPDGRRLAFSVSPAHHEGEDWDLAVMNIDGGGYVKLTTGPGNDRVPDWRRRQRTIRRLFGSQNSRSRPSSQTRTTLLCRSPCQHVWSFTRRNLDPWKRRSHIESTSLEPSCRRSRIGDWSARVGSLRHRGADRAPLG